MEVTYHLLEEFVRPPLVKRQNPIIIQAIPHFSFHNYQPNYPQLSHNHQQASLQINPIYLLMLTDFQSYSPKPLYYDDIPNPAPPPTTHIINDFAKRPNNRPTPSYYGYDSHQVHKHLF